MSRPTHAARADLHPLLREYIRLTGCRVYESSSAGRRYQYPGLRLVENNPTVYKAKRDDAEGYAYISGRIYHVEERCSEKGEIYYVKGEEAQL